MVPAIVWLPLAPPTIANRREISLTNEEIAMSPTLATNENVPVRQDWPEETPLGRDLLLSQHAVQDLRRQPLLDSSWKES